MVLCRLSGGGLCGLSGFARNFSTSLRQKPAPSANIRIALRLAQMVRNGARSALLYWKKRQRRQVARGTRKIGEQVSSRTNCEEWGKFRIKCACAFWWQEVCDIIGRWAGGVAGLPSFAGASIFAPPPFGPPLRQGYGAAGRLRGGRKATMDKPGGQVGLRDS